MKSSFRQLVCLCPALWFGGVLAGLAGGVESWHLRSPAPTTEPLFRAARGQGLTILAGGINTNMLVVSVDGTNWFPGPSTGTRKTSISPYAYALNDILFVNDRFVAVGDRTAVSSLDGTNWTSTNLTMTLKSVAYGNGRFVAVAENGGTAISTDGVVWTVTSANAAGSRGVIFALGKFYLGAKSIGVRVSSDGVTWNDAPGSFYSPVHALTYGGGRFIAVGQNGDLYSSPDAVVWNRTMTFSLGLNSVAYGNNLHVVVGDGGQVYTSPNGTNWTRWLLDNRNLHGVSFIDGQFITAGDAGQIWTSPTGTNWTRRSLTPAGIGFNRIGYLHDRFIAAGLAGSLASSLDGVTWQRHTIGGTPTFTALAYGNGVYVAGGYNLYISADGSHWTQAPNSVNAAGLAFGQGVFVAAGKSGEIRSSPDLTNWTLRVSGTTLDFHDVIFARGRFVAVAESGVMRTSVNGLDWTPLPTNSVEHLVSIVHADERYMALGNLGGLTISSNGTDWIHRQLTNNGPDCASLATGDGVVVVLDQRYQRLRSSVDLGSWTGSPLRSSYQVNSVAYGAGTFVAVGGVGQIWQSDPVLRLSMTASEQGTLLLHGPLGVTCAIERSLEVDDANWTQVGLATLTNTPAPWTDQEWFLFPRAFYRARVLGR